MKKGTHNSTSNPEEALIQKTLRTTGYLFPETVEEVIEFEKNFGDTDVILPEELENPTFLSKKKNPKAKMAPEVAENYAMAAREGSDRIPSEIWERMEFDRKKSDSKRKKHKHR